jgi:signal transduction histidine kinase
MITDDGIGFCKEGINRQNSFGLLAMKERSIALSGKLEISSQKNKGTSIHLSLPYQDQN